MLQVRPIAESTAHAYDVAKWFRDVRAYSFGDFPARCTVLGSLFKGSDYPTRLKVVAEHLIPRSQYGAASMIGIDVYSPENGVILCKQLQKMLQAGDWSLVPLRLVEGTDSICCRVHVASASEDRQLFNIDGVVSEGTPLMVHNGTQKCHLKMRHLHGQLVHMRKPFIRSLLLKNLMAAKEHVELPNPLHPDRLQTYVALCPKIAHMSLEMILAAHSELQEPKEEQQKETTFMFSPSMWIGGTLVIESEGTPNAEPARVAQQQRDIGLRGQGAEASKRASNRTSSRRRQKRSSMSPERRTAEKRTHSKRSPSRSRASRRSPSRKMRRRQRRQNE
eukprot:6464726-Amphidinium_carterae.1